MEGQGDRHAGMYGHFNRNQGVRRSTDVLARGHRLACNSYRVASRMHTEIKQGSRPTSLLSLVLKAIYIGAIFIATMLLLVRPDDISITVTVGVSLSLAFALVGGLRIWRQRRKGRHSKAPVERSSE